MSDHSDTNLNFATLDRLLDQALCLSDEERERFLAELGETQREALVDLLQEAQSVSLSRISTIAQKVVREVEHSDDNVDTVLDTKAGEWQLKREIGSGGTGQVFYAERHELDGNTGEDNGDAFVQHAAVKVLWSHQVRSQFRDRFLRERRILASIDHPGLARFLDGGLLGDGRPWFAMEYVDGDDIVNFTKARPVNERLALFLEVADTIDYAHQRLIVHRDIKPQNILVDPRGKPRVLDFGIAVILGDLGNQKLTSAQGTPMTLQYASPEQVTGDPIDVASDVYQLGLLLYEMLTGNKPYRLDDTSLQAAVDTIRYESPPPPSRYANNLGSDLDAIVTKALRKDPGARYRSVAAMTDDVRRYIEGRPITARPQSAGYILSRFIRRNALLTSIVTASVVALTFATMFSMNSAMKANAEAERSRITQEILAGVFEQADPFGEGGAEVTLADALVRAKPFIKETVANDPRLAWEVNKTMVGIFTNLDLLDLEREALQAAWDAALTIDGDNETERLFAIAGLGNILVRTDPSEGVSFLAKHLPSSPSTSRSAIEWLSAKYAEVSAYIRLRDYDRADQGAADMARVAREFEIDAPRTLGRIDQLLAGAARRAGNLDTADQHWANAVENMRRADAPLGLAVTLSNYALHYGMTKRYEASAAAFEESIEIFRNHETDNTSHANVLRLYAGLLFRMRRADEAQGALDEALAILDPNEQRYAYFIAQLNRANFAFADGEMEIVFDAIDQGLHVAVPAFGHDSEVTQRMRPVFARLLLFADRPFQAASLANLDDRRSCADRNVLTAAIDEAVVQLADTPETEGARQTVWTEIERLRSAATNGALRSDQLAVALATYRNPPDAFFDALDRYRFIVALSDFARFADAGVSAELHAELERMQAQKARARKLVSDDARLGYLVGLLNPGRTGICESF